MKPYISLLLIKIIYKLTILRKMIRYFLSVDNINGIELYRIDIEMHPIYLKIHFIYHVYIYLILHFR